ncbi:MAG: ribonuclease III, partial [Myxococcota bacterium]
TKPPPRQPLSKRLAYTFRDPKLLQRAFQHRSYVHEKKHKIKIQSYERLEFLGDAVLELLITEYLWHTFPEISEGRLTALRAKLVKQSTLAQIARDLRLGEDLLLGRGEKKRRSHQRDSLLADVFEALLGAFYLDAGLERTREFCLPLFEEALQHLEEGLLRSPKNELQEWAAQHRLPAPQYRLIRKLGPAHDPLFLMAAKIEGFGETQAGGHSKKIASNRAAQTLLNLLQAAPKSHPSKDVQVQTNLLQATPESQSFPDAQAQIPPLDFTTVSPPTPEKLSPQESYITPIEFAEPTPPTQTLSMTPQKKEP